MLDDPLFPDYKKARNRIRKFEPLSMVALLIDCLHKAHTGGEEVLKTHQPWHILLALKWTFQEMDGLCHRRPPAKLNDAYLILNTLHDAVPPFDFTHPTLFMRQFAFQQFWIFQGPDGSALARQEILFGQLPANHKFSRQFLSLTGITISEYLDLAFSVMALFISTENRRHIDRSDFRTLESTTDPKKIDSFLVHLSKTPAQLHVWLNDTSIKNVPVVEQMVLPSPLMSVPFLRMGNRLTAYYPPLVYRALEQAIYRPLRTIDPAAFGGTFGLMFEAYIGNLMKDAGLTFLNEAALKSRLTGEGMVVDFHLVEDNCNLLIDSKGVEMSAPGRTATSAHSLYSATKRSAMKAVGQGMDTLARIRKTPAGHWGTGETFLIVVTFESLYFGTGSGLGEIFDDTLVADLQNQFGLPFPFPLENVFFLSIREFEDLLARVRTGRTTILQSLRAAKAADADRTTRKFEFAQHLMAQGEVSERLPFIQQGLIRLQERCIKRLGKSPGPSAARSS